MLADQAEHANAIKRIESIAEVKFDQHAADLRRGKPRMRNSPSAVDERLRPARDSDTELAASEEKRFGLWLDATAEELARQATHGFARRYRTDAPVLLLQAAKGGSVNVRADDRWDIAGSNSPDHQRQGTSDIHANAPTALCQMAWAEATWSGAGPKLELPHQPFDLRWGQFRRVNSWRWEVHGHVAPWVVRVKGMQRLC
jgi:hypothetical protein